MNNMTMPNMGTLGGPVGPPMPMGINNGAMGPQAGPRQLAANDHQRTLLNTYIYEYFLRYGMFECARALLASDSQVKVTKDSPGSRRDDNGNLIGNGLGDDPMDTDSKDDLDRKRPDDLPAPDLPMPLPDSCFLYEWFALFWDMLAAQKGKGSNPQVTQYVQHSQQQSRMRQVEQQQLLRQMRPANMTQQQYQQEMMRMQNGGMNMNMKAGNNLQRAAMANSQNPQMMALQNKAGNMQRDPSDLEGNRQRPASPGSTDNAPSPSKRPRLENGPFNPNQAVMMQNGRPAQAMGQQHHGNQMPNKSMPNAAGPQGQGSPMVPQGPDGAAIGAFYNHAEMNPAAMRPGAPGNGQGGGGSNHALQDYQMQLMLLEQQNKKRLMMARQEQDMNGNMPRTDGQAGPGAPGGPGGGPGPGGPAGQAFPGAASPGGRSGASPNPAEQMKRGNPQMGNAANMGSPLPEGASRSSPNPMGFMGNQMDPNGQFYKNMNGGMDMNMVNAAQLNGGMRPPSSHPNQPGFNGQMTPQQMMAARQAQQQAQGGPQMQWSQGGPNAGQMGAQGPQQPVQGTPQTRPMPPPAAPGPNNANSRNTTSSPQVSTAAPPTPQQSNKANPKKKDTKNTKAKTAAQKKGSINSGATPAAEPAAEQEAPTPATPITPVNPGPFNTKVPQNAGPTVAPNGQPAAPPQAAAPVPPPHQDPTSGAYNMDGGSLDFTSMDFANPLVSNDVLNDFDFDSFLHDGGADDAGAFDFGTGPFMEGGEIGAD